MDAIKLGKVLNYIAPGKQWAIRGDSGSYDSIEWLERSPKPSREEIAQGEIAIDRLAYRERRAAEYPPIGDQLDALWSIVSGNADAESNAIKQKIADIKSRYQKP